MPRIIILASCLVFCLSVIFLALQRQPIEKVLSISLIVFAATSIMFSVVGLIIVRALNREIKDKLFEENYEKQLEQEYEREFGKTFENTYISGSKPKPKEAEEEVAAGGGEEFEKLEGVSEQKETIQEGQGDIE